MTDKELLELAAKAIGLKLRYNYLGGRDANHPWDPLEDDGYALRLAVKLQIHMAKYDNYASACQLGSARENEAVVWDHEEPDPYAATRRAIVRAAAEIGKAMP
jgi:hypothetical protein